MIRIDGYAVDSAVEERLTYESEVTEFPVEKGADVTDHIRAKRPVLELDCVISDTPTGAVAEDASRQLLDGSILPSRDALDFFQKLHTDRRKVTIECSFGKFDDMVMTSLPLVRNKDTLKALKFTVTFNTIEFAENARTAIRVAVPGAGSRQNLGTLLGLVRDLNVTYVTSHQADPKLRAGFIRQGFRLVSTTTHAQRIATWRRAHGETEFDAITLTTVPTAGFDAYAVFGEPGKVDHFFAENTETSDGFVTGHSKQDYYPYVSHVTETSFNGKPVRWDWRTDSWVDEQSNIIVQKPPKGADRWKGITMVHAPGPTP